MEVLREERGDRERNLLPPSTLESPREGRALLLVILGLDLPGPGGVARNVDEEAVVDVLRGSEGRLKSQASRGKGWA